MLISAAAVVVAQSPSCVRLFSTLRTAARQASLFLHLHPKFAQVHVYCIGDATQPSHPLYPFKLLRNTEPSSLNTLLYLKWITNKDLLYCTGKSNLPLNFSAPLYLTDLMNEDLLRAYHMPGYL